MTDTEQAKVERVAKAMWDASGNAVEEQFGTWEYNQKRIEGGRSIADIYRDHARAAIAAMPKPDLEKVARALADRRGSKVVQRAHRLDAIAAIAAMESAENDALRADVIAFCGPWAGQWAKDRDLPKGALHPVHYDILERAGARMADFTKADPIALKALEGTQHG